MGRRIEVIQLKTMKLALVLLNLIVVFGEVTSWLATTSYNSGLVSVIPNETLIFSIQRTDKQKINFSDYNLTVFEYYFNKSFIQPDTNQTVITLKQNTFYFKIVLTSPLDLTVSLDYNGTINNTPPVTAIENRPNTTSRFELIEFFSFVFIMTKNVSRIKKKE